MNAAPLKQQIYLLGCVEQLIKIDEFLAAHEADSRGFPAQRYFLSAIEPTDRINLPAELLRMLGLVTEALRRGSAVTVAPRTITVTAQEAAGLLGISLATVIKLVDEGNVTHEGDGKDCTFLLRDLLDYRERRRAEHNAALRLL
ncbi:MAG TPA: helix-turn-helix domain-containing protein [Pseudonocardiaceae bacterium]